MSNEFSEIFQEEAKELLETLERDLLDLEDSPENSDIVARIFRTMHTIKGSGAMFGFTAVADFTHHVENILASVRDGDVPVSRELISLVLQSRDHITALIAGDDSDPGKGIFIIEKLTDLGKGAGVQLPPAESSSPAEKGRPVMDDGSSVGADDLSVEVLLEKCSVIAGDLFMLVGTPEDKQVLTKIGSDFMVLSQGAVQQGWNEFGAFIQAISHCIEQVLGQGAVTLPLLDLCDTARNFIEDVLRAGTPPSPPTYQDLLGNIKAEVLESAGGSGSREQEEPLRSARRLGEILVDNGHVAEDVLTDVIAQQLPLGEMLVRANVVMQDHVDDALVEQQKQKAIKVRESAPGAVIKTDSIRVAAEKLDVLINLVGELVVTQSRLSEIGGRHPDSELLEAIEDVERLTTELRECVLSVRMLPIGSTFSRFKRLVRDLSNDLGKDVNLLTSGAETELDKTMLEMLVEPLVHLIRNAVDHGIETPAEREAKGKEPFGTISLGAMHAGANVVVTISDDGRGIDRAALLEKGVALGLVPADLDPMDKKTLELIFHPGMTTSTEINTVSGRGVGMDVVHSSVLTLKGTVTVTSHPETGTTLTLTIPLTMAIIDGLLVQAGETSFILPLLQIEECIEFTESDGGGSVGRHVYQFRDKLIPFIRLREFYGLDGELPVLEQMVIVRLKKEFMGIVVDHIIGDHQTVIKSLGWVYREAPGLSGATILGDGQVALIIDITGIHAHALSEELLRVDGDD